MATGTFRLVLIEGHSSLEEPMTGPEFPKHSERQHKLNVPHTNTRTTALKAGTDGPPARPDDEKNTQKSESEKKARPPAPGPASKVPGGGDQRQHHFDI